MEAERQKTAYQPFAVNKFQVRCDYGQNYTFQQLLTYDDFKAEGVKMRHCVGAYFYYCVSEATKRSVWHVSLGKADLLTLDLIGKHIIQVRGYCNRKTTDDEKLVVVKWAEWLKLSVGESAF